MKQSYSLVLSYLGKSSASGEAELAATGSPSHPTYVPDTMAMVPTSPRPWKWNPLETQVVLESPDRGVELNTPPSPVLDTPNSPVIRHTHLPCARHAHLP